MSSSQTGPACARLHLKPSGWFCECVTGALANSFTITMCAAPLWKTSGYSLLTLLSQVSQNTHAPLICSLSFLCIRLRSHTHTPSVALSPLPKGLPLPPRRLSGFSVTLDVGRVCAAGPCRSPLSICETSWLSRRTWQLSLDLQSGKYCPHSCCHWCFITRISL